ncbi:MAG: SET domain-containing methyltransferase [bacterium]
MESKKFLTVKNTKNRKGVFADKNFKKGETIFEFHGKFFTYEELPTPYNEVEDHFVQIGENLYMGPSGGIDDFFNHSCAPNAGLKIEDKKVFLTAIKNISSGDEITWDYSTTMDEDDWEMDCECESKTCRRRIRDFKYLPPEIQKKYLNLGIVPKYISEDFQKEFAAKTEIQ